MRSSRSVLFCASLCLALNALTAAALGDDEEFLKISMDHARILKLDRAVSKVIVGNDQIADVTVADAKTIVLTGRSFGTTNLVLLDSAGNAIVDERLLVTLDEARTIRVYRQTDRDVLFCSTSCEPMNVGGSGSNSTGTSPSASTPD
jgi:Flp pilus assembly secretin CpaC